MKLINYALLALSFISTLSSIGMNHNGTNQEESVSDTEESASENKPHVSVHILKPGWYAVHFKGAVINENQTTEELYIGLYANNKQKLYKRYTLNPNSRVAIDYYMLAKLKNNDFLELKFNAPKNVHFNISILPELLGITKL
jgi:hypothetical protein